MVPNLDQGRIQLLPLPPGVQGWICPYYLTSARCPCTAITKNVPRVPCHRRRLDGDNCDDDDSDDDDNVGPSDELPRLRGDQHQPPDRFNLFLIRADEVERHAAYHTVDRLTALLSLLAEDVEREIIRSAQFRRQQTQKPEDLPLQATAHEDSSSVHQARSQNHQQHHHNTISTKTSRDYQVPRKFLLSDDGCNFSFRSVKIESSTSTDMLVLRRWFVFAACCVFSVFFMLIFDKSYSIKSSSFNQLPPMPHPLHSCYHKVASRIYEKME